MVDYDKSSPESILDFAKQLTGKSLAELADIPFEVMNKKNKGDLGSLLENFYFEHRPATNSGPDFEEAGVELKATGVVPHKVRKYKANQRDARHFFQAMAASAAINKWAEKQGRVEA